MDIWNVEKLSIFLIFFLPGFISMKIYDLMVPGEARDFSKSFLEAISYSTLNFAALFWLIVIIQSNDFYHRHFGLYSLLLFIIMVAVPCCWPFVLIRLFAWRRIAKYFVHPVRKPWDYVFGKHAPYWIIVHLKSGQRIGGYFGQASFASSNPAQEQIYMEEVWILDEAGRFTECVEASRGIIIMNDEIRAVELFDQ